MAGTRTAAMTTALLASACSFDWDGFDPRLADSGAGGAGTPASTGSGGASTTSNGGMTSVGGTGGTGGSRVQSLDYLATIAECIEPTAAMPDPEACEAATALNNMKVDLADAISGLPSYSYVRFDLDAALAGHEVVRVTLRLTTTDDMEAAGISTGELWEVAPFTKQDLYLGPPAPIGSAPLAPDEGPASANALVEYDVPVGFAQPNAGVFLSLVPTSTDGVNYWNTRGNAPPILRVEYR